MLFKYLPFPQSYNSLDGVREGVASETEGILESVRFEFESQQHHWLFALFLPFLWNEDIKPRIFIF